MPREKKHNQTAVIKFYVDGKLVEFKVKHNCPPTFGLSIQNAVDNWIPRAEEFSGKDLAEYITSKGFNCIVIQETKNIYKADFKELSFQSPKSKKK